MKLGTNLYFLSLTFENSIKEEVEFTANNSEEAVKKAKRHRKILERRNGGLLNGWLGNKVPDKKDYLIIQKYLV